jgi:hypothetical protein
MLFIARLARRVTAIAFGLAGGLVFDDAAYAIPLGSFTLFRLGSRKSFDLGKACLFGRGLSRLFGGLGRFAFQSSLLARRGNRLAFCELLGKLRRGRFASSAVVLQQRLAGVGSAIQSVGEVLVSLMLQFSFRRLCGRETSPTLFGFGLLGIRQAGREFFRFPCLAKFPQARRLLIARLD